MTNYLGIDYGRKRIGLAFADELGVAIPISAIPGVELEGSFEQLDNVVKIRQADELVVGYPLNMDGTPGTRAREVDAYVVELEKRFGLPVRKVDERLTTHAAAQDLKASRKRMPGKETGELDSAAATLILRDFLEERNPFLLPDPEDYPELEP